MRLSGIRRGSLLDRLGFNNGDVLHTLNGASALECGLVLPPGLEGSIRARLTRGHERLDLVFHIL